MPNVSLQAITPKRFKLNQAKLRIDSRANMARYLNDVKRIMQEDYEKVPTGPHYTRTRELYDSWEVNISADGSEGTLTNSSPHAVYAQGPRGGGRGKGERQAQHMRKKGWKSISDVAREQSPSFVRLMNRSYGPAAFSVEQ